jgi:hypothetical protein
MPGANSSEQHRTSQEEQHRRSGSPARLLPRVTSGLGIAVLTGIAVVTVTPGPAARGAKHIVTTAALGAAINGAGIGSTPMDTTWGRAL